MDKDEIGVGGPVVATAQRIEHLGGAIREPHVADLAALRYSLNAVRRDVAPDVDRLLGEVDIRPAQTSQFAQPQAGERDDEDRCVLLTRGTRGERLDLLRVSTEKSPERVTVTRSASSAGFEAIHFLRFARFRIPCSGTRIFWIVRRDSRPSSSMSSRNSSMSSVVNAATGVAAPKPGRRYLRTVLRQSRTVDAVR
ncbi:MAG TPA: hypothetical protein VFR32_03305 [Gaiellaceae bacterium]|nr:hypothetical protein [Gaiellaceae bacterium]